LTLEPELGLDCGGLEEWAREEVVKVLCFCHPDDDSAMRKDQEETVKRLFEASRRNGLEFLLEIIPSKVGKVDDTTNARLIDQFYQAGVYPDWWKLEPMKTIPAWKNAIGAIEAHDAHTRGIVVLGLDAPEAELAQSFEAAASFDLVKGFAVGRTIFGTIALAWLNGELGDNEAVFEMAGRFERLCGIWDRARSTAMER
jgi:5-dehydro-2-deoxygluconokinase